MWFRYPEGFTGISIERQQFAIDYTDAKGTNYFRAPEHFAPRILEINRGFAIVDQPAGAVEDLPKADPLRDGAIATLTKEREGQKVEIANLRSDLIALQRQLGKANGEKAALENQLATVVAERDRLAELAEDHDLEHKKAPKAK